MLALVLAAMMALQNRVRDRQELHDAAVMQPAAGGESTGQTVSLTIHFGDDRERQFPAVAWREGMSVADLLAATQHSSSATAALKWAVQGSGASAFLAEIDGVGNEGAGGRNWTYSVNKTRADRSFALYELQPGDHVLWSFARTE